MPGTAQVGSPGISLHVRRVTDQVILDRALTVADEHAFPGRHLGLLTADERVASEERLGAWGRLVADSWDLDATVALARTAPALARPERAAVAPPRARCRIGIAFDEAFHFYYEDNLERLAQAGATLVRFSPLRDRCLPPVDGLYLGGGYPEFHAAGLAANETMKADLRAFAERGRPVYAECGGLMYLCRGIRTLDGRAHPMVGIFPGEAVMSPRLDAIGYVEGETRAASLLGGAGLRFRGHQFRHSRLVGMEEVATTYALRRPGAAAVTPEGFARHNVLASYVHVHWASNPALAEGFVASCAG